MTKINDGQTASTIFTLIEKPDDDKAQEKRQLAKHNLTQTTRDVTPAAVQKNGASKPDASNTNKPSSTTGNEKSAFSEIVDAASEKISSGADRIKSKLSKMKGAAGDYIDEVIKDKNKRTILAHSLTPYPLGVQIGRMASGDNAVSRLNTLGADDNVKRMKETVAPERQLKSESESKLVGARVVKTAVGSADTTIRVYRYPDGNAQIELFSHVKGAGGRAVEWNVGDSPTYKGTKSKTPAEGQSKEKDITVSFAEWIGSSGGEGSYTSRTFIESKNGVSGWDRAQSFLKKMEKEKGDERFVPWKFIPAAEKEFGTSESGSTKTSGGIVDTKAYASGSMMPANLGKLPEGTRPVAGQLVRFYSELKGGVGLHGVHNRNNPDVGVSDEHTDSQNVQSEQFWGLTLQAGGGYKGALFSLSKPVSAGETRQGTFTAGRTEDNWVFTTATEKRTYTAKEFGDYRINVGKIPDKAHSSQISHEKGKETILKLRERDIVGISIKNPKELALDVNRREVNELSLGEQLDVIKDKLPQDVDLNKARKDLSGVFGREIGDKQWENFLTTQLDGNSRNNITSIGKKTGRKGKEFQRNRSEYEVKINEWRAQNNIDQLERAYQVNWPQTRDKMIAQGEAKIEKMDLAGTSEYLRERFILTPGTSSYTVLDGSAEVEQKSAGQSFPSKTGGKNKHAGLYKGVLYSEKQQHNRLGVFEIDTKHKEVVMDKILGSGDSKLSNAFLDIYNTQKYASTDKNGERVLLRPVFSGDARHINRIVDRTGVQPEYGKSVYTVKADDVKSGDRANDVIGRVITNGISQMSDGKETLETMHPNDKVRGAKLYQMVREFKEVNFPGASDKEIMERLEPGVPLMLMDFSRL